MTQAMLKNEKKIIQSTIAGKFGLSGSLTGNLIILDDFRKENSKRKMIGYGKMGADSDGNKKHKMVDANAIIGFLDVLQKDMIAETVNPRIKKELQEEEQIVLSHEMMLLDMIKNYVRKA